MMNHIHLRTIKNEAGEAQGPSKVYAHLTPDGDGERNLGGALRLAFEIPILQGERQPCPDGTVKYWFELNDEQATQLSQLLTILFMGAPTDN
jgi:hypothetical protein